MSASGERADSGSTPSVFGESASATTAVAGASSIRTCALVPEKPQLLAWVCAHWPRWVPEVEAALARLPVACFIALRDGPAGGDLLGFACHDAIALNFFGPEGVVPQARGQGIGRALLLSVLHAQRAQGYAYAIIGGAGPVAFYARAVGAVPIAGSNPGIYAGMLRD